MHPNMPLWNSFHPDATPVEVLLFGAMKQGPTLSCGNIRTMQHISKHFAFHSSTIRVKLKSCFPL